MSDAELGSPRARQQRKLAVSKRGMVSTAHPLATRAGVEILEAGGNAVDAAVAAAFALGSCEPAACGLGGQTFILLYDAKSRRTVALDGSSRAPNRATPEFWIRKRQLKRGHTASTVPSTPAALDYARRRFGTLKLPDLLGPAIRIADEGFAVSELLHSLMKRETADLKAGSGGAFFLRRGATPYPVGSVLRQPVLARTLRRLADKGVRDFYRGDIAALIDKDMRAHGGLIRLDDLALIPRPIERRPLATRFDDLRVMTFPPPAAGRTLIEMLNVYASAPRRWRDLDTPKGAAFLAHTIRRAFLDRADRPMDPEYFPQTDSKMLRPAYAKKVAQRIARRLEFQGETTHLSVMDRAGNAVALTQSIERVFGSCEASPDLGFLYNNYMYAFEYKDPAHPYYLRPNAAPWASVAPTLAFAGRRPVIALGSPGSERIAPAILQVLLRLKRAGPYGAVAAPRLHCSLEGTVSLEAPRMRDDVPDFLDRLGFKVDERDAFSFYLGCVQMVLRGPGGTFTGVADPRRDGTAAGPK